MSDERAPIESLTTDKGIGPSEEAVVDQIAKTLSKNTVEPKHLDHGDNRDIPPNIHLGIN